MQINDHHLNYFVSTTMIIKKYAVERQNKFINMYVINSSNTDLNLPLLENVCTKHNEVF